MISINIIEIIKKAAMDAVKESSPTELVFGLVTSIDPLEITIDQKIKLTSEFIILSTIVCDFDVEMTVDHVTEKTTVPHTHIFTGVPNGGGAVAGTNDSQDIEHAHDYVGRKKFTVHMGLEENEKVIMIQIQGGQKYFVVDRVRGDDI